MQVRLATSQDLPKIYAIYNVSDSRDLPFIMRSSFEESLAKGCLVIPDPIVGFLRCNYRMRDKVLVIYDLLVDKNSRGEGMAKAMIAHMIELFPESPLVTLKCAVDRPANSFYPHLGFEEGPLLLPDGRRKRTLQVWEHALPWEDFA